MKFLFTFLLSISLFSQNSFSDDLKEVIDNGIRDEKNIQIKFNFEEPITNKIIFNSELNYFNTDFKSSQISLSRKSLGWYIDTGFNFKLSKI